MAKADVKVITGGRLIDGTGKPALSNATVVVEDATIKAAGKNIAIPKQAQIINAKGKTIMPGMIDTHRHFVGCWPDDTDMDAFTLPREVRFVRAINDAKNYLAGGFTTARECGGMNGIYMRRAVSLGDLSGIPRMVSAGYMLFNSRGMGYNKFIPNEYVDARTSQILGHVGNTMLICDGVDECIKAARYALNQGADFIKVVPTGGSYFSLDELKAIGMVVEYQHKFFTSHCDDARQIKESIIAGAKTVDHAVGIDDEAIEMGKKADIVFVSTLSVMQCIIDFGGGAKRLAHGRDWALGMREKMATSYKKIKKAGGMMAVGTDMGGESLMENYGASAAAVEMALLIEHCGFSPMDAIVAATKHGAMACCLGDKTGTIEAGKSADIIIVDGDPLANIKILQDKDKIKMVMLEGKIEKSTL